VSHVFLVPWLRTGGADLEALNYIRLAAEHPAAAGVLVLVTDQSAYPWARLLPAGVKLVDFAKLAGGLSARAAQRLLGTFLVQLGPRVIHNLNSRLGYEVFEGYGPALRRVAGLYASAFCEDVTPAGKAVGYAVDQIPRCAE